MEREEEMLLILEASGESIKIYSEDRRRTSVQFHTRFPFSLSLSLSLCSIMQFTLHLIFFTFTFLLEREEKRRERAAREFIRKNRAAV